MQTHASDPTDPPIPDQPTIPDAPSPGTPDDVPDIGTPEPEPDQTPRTRTSERAVASRRSRASLRRAILHTHSTPISMLQVGNGRGKMCRVVFGGYSMRARDRAMICPPST